MKRACSVVLIVCAVAEAAIPARAQAPAASVTITSMDRSSLRPFDRLVITGSGFQPASSSISVIFTPRTHGATVAVPAINATATTVDVFVPASLDAPANDFGFGQVDVQVVQVSKDTVQASNVLSGLDIAPIPRLADSIGLGRITRALMRTSLSMVSDALGRAPTPEARAALTAFKDGQTALVAQVESVVARPSHAVAASTIDDTPFVVDQAMLAASDRLLAAWLDSVVQQVGLLAVADQVGAWGENDPCSPDTGASDWDQKICLLDQLVKSKWRVGVGAIIVGISVGFFAAAMTPPAAAFVALGSLIALAGAAQLAYIAGSAVMASAPDIIDGVPPIVDTVRDYARKALENAASTAGEAITTVATAASDAVSDRVNRWSPPSPPSPAQSTLWNPAPTDTAAAIQAMINFQGGKDNTQINTIGIPNAQSTKTLFESRVAPPTIQAFDGAYGGSLNWFAGDGEGHGDAGSATVAFSISNGVISVTAPLGGSGSVAPSGRVGGGGGDGGLACGFTGFISAVSANAAASGGGTFACHDSEGSVWGGWSASRAAKP